MPIPNLKDGEEVVKEIKNFTPKQIAVIILLITSCISTAFWVENRYAKIQEIEQQFSRNQQILDKAYFLALELFDLLTDDQKKAILIKQQIAKQNDLKN